MKIKSIRSSKLKISQQKLNHLAAKIKSFRKNAAFCENPEKMVKFGENSAKFGQLWANLRNFGKKTAKNSQRFLTLILRLESSVPHFSPMDSKAVQRSALCRSRRELSNEYLLAKISVDTAENEPLQVWG